MGSPPLEMSKPHPGTAQGSPEAPVCDPGVVPLLGSALASIHPQGLRQFSVIAEGAEIVPSLPDPIAGSVGSLLAASKALDGVSSGGFCLASVCLIRDT